MSEQARFQAWWESTGTNSVILRAQAWSAWQAAITIEQTTPDPHIALMEAEHDDRMQPQTEDPDEWVILDPVKYADHVPRVGIDQFGSDEKGWRVQCAHHTVEPVGEYYDEYRLYHRCRRRDLPKVEQAEQWPKYYEYQTNALNIAFVKRVSATKMAYVDRNGCETIIVAWSTNDERRRELTEAEAMALLNKPTSDGGTDWSYHEKQKPQPQKKMLRLWIDSDCNIHAGLKGDNDLELHYDHETRQFYTEETR